ncbi:hypothetical protein ACFLTH_11620 [Bacteroidota bacterium]
MLSIIFFAFLFYACDDTIVQTDIDNRIIPESGVSFAEHIYSVLNAKCAFSGCHEDQTRAGNFSVTTWSNVVADPQIVFPYYPNNSKLIWAIEWTGSSPMPPVGYPYLTRNQIEGITTWVIEGAKNN